MGALPAVVLPRGTVSALEYNGTRRVLFACQADRVLLPGGGGGGMHHAP